MLKPLRIQVERGRSGLLMASSPDLAGLHVMERTEDELFASLRELIPVLFAEKGENIRVVSITPIADDEPSDSPPWVIAGIRVSKSERIRS